ncbi:hypothetical protein M433DRAFT_10378 [Acidomyces richmondensis BFW]|nr:hypothetical protein M433DRAFT_10378 [Acidomyces richmondensis BFW]
MLPRLSPSLGGRPKKLHQKYVVESDGLSVLRPGKSAPKRREESNGNQDRDEG